LKPRRLRNPDLSFDKIQKSVCISFGLHIILPNQLLIRKFMCRCSKKRSAIEDVNAKLDTTTREPLRHEEKRLVLPVYCLHSANAIVSNRNITALFGLNICRKSQRRKSARLNSVSSEDTDITVETEHKDVASLAGSSSNASMEQRTNQEQNDGWSSRKSNVEQISGRRSLRRAAEKVVSYKEVPLNVKMRRP